MKQETIFGTIRILKDKGLSVDEAIAEVEARLRGRLSEDIIARIKTDIDKGDRK